MPRVPIDAPAMRIVVDTNTVVSGLLWPGPSRRLLDLARAGKYTTCTSVSLLAELAEVIGRKKFAQRLQAAGLSASALVQDYGRLSAIVEPATLPQPVCRDPDDDLVLATALSAQAFLIVSGDLDLLDLGSFRDIRIVNAADALRALGA